MTFRFNFQLDDKIEEKKDEDDLETNTNVDVEHGSVGREIDVTECQDLPCDIPVLKYNIAGTDRQICYYDNVAIEKYICQINKGDNQYAVVKAASEHSDLVPNVYEGGLTLWECALDLTEFLAPVDLKEKTVLELGCGAGIPGLYSALQGGAKEVHFQDYNEEVLQFYTIPNIKLQGTLLRNCRCRFFSGDWATLPQILNDDKASQKYDVILTAETIYNPDNYPKLHNVLDQCLSSQGQIYLAAKSVYFGVGGGTRLFEDFIKSRGKFVSEVCHTVTAAIQREILKITRSS